MTTTTARFRGTCNSAALGNTHGTWCNKVVMFWTGTGRTMPNGRQVDTVKCPNCPSAVMGYALKANAKADVVCAAKCTNAKSAGCECSCGGLNHGAAHERRAL